MQKRRTYADRKTDNTDIFSKFVSIQFIYKEVES